MNRGAVGRTARRGRTRAPGLSPWLVASGLLAALAVVLALAYVRERIFLAEFARQAGEGAPATDSARVAHDVAFLGERLSPTGPAPDAGWLARVYYAVNPMHPGPGDVVRWGADWRGPCGSYSRVMHVVLDEQGVRNRFLFLTDAAGTTLHTVLEARIDGRWVVVDPSYGIVYRHPDGRGVAVNELRNDPGLLRRHVEHVKGYDARYDYRYTTHLNWRKVPVLMPALRALLVTLLGEARVSEIGRPDIWIWPRLLGSLASAAGAVLAFLVFRMGRSA